jgi:hypothetical protein
VVARINCCLYDTTHAYPLRSCTRLDVLSTCFGSHFSAFLSILSNKFVNVSAHLHDYGRSSQSRIECRKTKYVNFYTLRRVWIDILVLLPGHGSNICGVEGCLLAVISGM